MNLSERSVSPEQAAQFTQLGLEQLDHLLLGEMNAKMAILGAMVTGENVLLVGNPGGGKTTLGADSYRLIHGIEANQVAEFPPLADLTPQQLVGGGAAIEKKTTIDGVSSVEMTETSISAILRPDTNVIFANEINRMSPYAANAVLEAFESGLVNTSTGSVRIQNLLYGVATMNPSESRQGTFPISHAMASRFAFGAILGEGKSDKERRDQSEKIMRGFEPQPQAITPFVTIEDIARMRQSYGLVPISDTMMPRAVDLALKTVDTLSEHVAPNIAEADGRLSIQVAQTAKAMAFLGGGQVVEEKHLVDSVSYLVTARLGALSQKAYEEAGALVQQIAA